MLRRNLFAALAAACLATHAVAESFPVKIEVDARAPGGELTPIWRFFGADEPNYATMKDGRALLAELGSLKKDDIYFRAHNLLSSGDGTPALKWGSSNAYSEDAAGNAVYDWRIVDGIFDAYLANGVRPFVQLGFMPQALSSAPASVPYKHSWRPGFDYNLISGGWAYPPRDYQRWSDLCFELTRHLVQRYGREEVLRWWFETWNEPNGPAYWKASAEDFYKLHDYAIAGVRRALPGARVGGPHTAGHGGPYMEGFLDHITTGKNYATGETGTPTDFLAFHAKGAPNFVEGHVRMGIKEHLATIDRGFQMIAARSALKGKPIVIGESDPEGCAACQGPRFSYRNGTMYSSYTAASFARKHELAARHGVNLQGALTWAFEFEDQPYFAGFRQLASNGIDMPVLNVFRMFSRMQGRRLPATSSRQAALDDSPCERRAWFSRRGRDGESRRAGARGVHLALPRRRFARARRGHRARAARTAARLQQGRAFPHRCRSQQCLCGVATHGLTDCARQSRLGQAARRGSARCVAGIFRRRSFRRPGAGEFHAASPGGFAARVFAATLEQICRRLCKYCAHCLRWTTGEALAGQRRVAQLLL